MKVTSRLYEHLLNNNKLFAITDFANSQIDYIFGKNPLNQNYIVGERSNSPKFPHSAPASGFSSLKEALKHPQDLSKAHTIYGGKIYSRN